MTDISRRSFLRQAGVVAAVAGTAGAFTQPAHADAANIPIETFGTAALTAAVVGMAVEGNTAYLVTRGQTPPKVVTVDLANRTVTSIARLARGDGGWATTVSGGKVYVGTYPTCELYCYDPATAMVEFLGAIGPSGGFVWCLTTAPDGTVYAGTSPRGELWEYRPTTRVLRKIGRVRPDVQFARVVAADDRFVYVGTTPIRSIVAVDRVTGAMTDILPAEVPRAGGIYAIVATGERVIASAGSIVIDMAPDGSDATVTELPDNPPLIDAITVTEDGVVYAVARRTGTLYRRDDGVFVALGTPLVGDENRGLALLDESTVVGGAGSGVLWYHNIDTGTTEYVDLVETDVAGPDLVQSIAQEPGRAIYVGGHFTLTVHKPWNDQARRIRIAGEAKALLPMGDTVLAALYPSSEIIEIDVTTDQVRSVGMLGGDQQRPWEMAFDAGRGLVCIASAPGSGILTGALTLLDLATDKLEVYAGILPDQGITSVTVHDGIAYVAGDTWGGGSITPTRPTSQIGAFDLDTREVLWRREPLPACPSLQHVEVHDGILYGVYKRVSGTWFAMDLGTGAILRQGKLSGYGEIVTHRDQVFAATNFGDNIYRLRPDNDAEPLVVGLVASWFTVPQLEFEPRSWGAWGVSGRELARFDLAPRFR